MERNTSRHKEKTSKLRHLLRTYLFAGPEGGVLLTGIALSLLYIAWLGLTYLLKAENFQVFVGMTATHILFGRAAGLSFGYALGFGHGVVVPVNLIIEVIMVLIFFPLFVFGWRRLLIIDFLKNTMERIHVIAEANQETIKRYGIPGLFVFVFIPFWMTGPLIGSVIGFLLGLPSWLNMSVVLGGTFVATAAWAVVLRQLHERVAAYSPFAPMILVAILIVVVIVCHFLERARSGHGSQK